MSDNIDLEPGGPRCASCPVEAVVVHGGRWLCGRCYHREMALAMAQAESTAVPLPAGYAGVLQPDLARRFAAALSSIPGLHRDVGLASGILAGRMHS